ncbi:hypothetical protein [Phycicoccus sp. Soil748]|uniref:hypothetical protein n=1 Tax=Phycicoccus sp. Soil748 TaxID=1736397 RepID=UPI000703A3CC|nr:hypothetical protein [Phycicoccus sp. Soil748]
MGDEQQPGWAEGQAVMPPAGATPAAEATPSGRPPIELGSTKALTRECISAAARGTVLSIRGLVLGGVAIALGYLVVASAESFSWWFFAAAALALYLIEVGFIVWRLGRETRRILPPGSTARSWYTAPGVLALESGRGRTDFHGGSVESYQRRGTVTFLRLGRTRHRGFVPSALLTDEDLAFLLSPPTPGAARSGTTPGDDLPLELAVTAATRRDVQRAVVGRLWRQPSTYYFLGLAVLLLGFAVTDADAASGTIGVLCLGLVALRTVATVRLVGRMYRPGRLVRADITESGLRLRTDDDFEDTWPFASVRRCVLGRRVVRLDFGRSRPSLFLPRALFPAPELARLQQLVA